MSCFRAHDTTIRTIELEDLRRKMQGMLNIDPTSIESEHEKKYVSPDPDPTKYWTIKELCDLWGVSTSTLRREIRKGKLLSIKIGGTYRVPDNYRLRYETNKMASA